MKPINSNVYSIAQWLTHRLGRNAGSSSSAGSILNLSICGVALSLIVMLISVAVSLGFKRQVSNFAYSQTAHLSLYASGTDWLNNSTPFSLSRDLESTLEAHSDIKAIYPLVQQRAMLKTKEDYTGVLLFGIDSALIYPYYQERIIAGHYPTFSSLDSVHNAIILPSKLSERMKLKVGDKLQLYFLHSGIKVRTFWVVGLYDSSGLEQLPLLCPSSVLRGIDKLSEHSYHRVGIELYHIENSEAVLNDLVRSIEQNLTVLNGENLVLSLAEQMMPDIFSWLSLLDSNVYVLIILMLLVSGFTMIAGLLIIVLDKTQHIGILKALGSSNYLVSRVFILLAMRLASRALLWGNVIFGAVYYIQNTWHIIKLNPENYYLQFVPMELELWQWLSINILTIVVIFIVLLVPSRIVARISPADAMRFV